MKSNQKYNLHPDLKRFECLQIGNVRVTRPLLALNNAFARVSVALFVLPGDIKRTRHKIPGFETGTVNLTVYEPRGAQNNAPCLVYFHGGGFISRDFGFLHHVLCRYASQTPCKVVLVNYRLAPKFPFPVGLEDCYCALNWVFDNAELLGIDRDNVSIGGDSAGAALATVCAQLCLDRGGPSLRCQLLLYPVTDMSLSSRSITEMTDCPGCNPFLLKQMWACYLKNGYGETPHYASPMHAEVKPGFPAAYIEVQEFDSLKDEGKAYAEKLETGGVSVAFHEISGSFHAFDTAYKTNIAKKAIVQRVEYLQKHMYRERINRDY